jgi:hypothetical protein
MAVVERDAAILAPMVPSPQEVDLNQHLLQFRLRIKIVHRGLPVHSPLALPNSLLLPTPIWPSQLEEGSRRTCS